MRMSVENLNEIRAWALRNQDALPDLALRLVFASDLAKSVIEQESATDLQRIVEVGYDIANLMWRIRQASGYQPGHEPGAASSDYAAGTRVIVDALRRGITDAAGIIEYIESKVGKSVEVSEVVGQDDVLEMPEFAYRTIEIGLDDGTYTFMDTSKRPCRPSRIKNLRASISKARRL